MNQAPDPKKYSMYAAFRTKERGEKKAQAKRESIYDLNRSKKPQPETDQMRRTTDAQGGIYSVARSTRPAQARGSAPVPPKSPQNATARGTQTESARATAYRQDSARKGERYRASAQRQGDIYGTAAEGQRRVDRTAAEGQSSIYGASSRSARPQGQMRGAQPTAVQPQKPISVDRSVATERPTAVPAAQAQQPSRAPKQAQSERQPQKTVSTRVQNKGDDAYRYGFHSSYRTSDGRILDGFDKTGKPIYRESGGAAVVRHVGSDVDVARLHPVRRIRVETLVDTKKKPFPFMLVLTMLFCTAMVMGVLYSYMRLNECTNTLSTLNYRLSQLRNETNTLTAEVVRREDLIAIEQTASETLGMVKNDVLTKRYVSIENEDKTEIFVGNVEVGNEHDTVKIDLKTGAVIDETEGQTTADIQKSE